MKAIFLFDTASSLQSPRLYLSDNEMQAFEMAKQKVLQQGTGKEIINIFEFDEKMLDDPLLRVKIFKDYNEEWAEFVLTNRNKASKENPTHDYDIVIGPIADDKVGLQIQRNMNDKDATIMIEGIAKDLVTYLMKDFSLDMQSALRRLYNSDTFSKLQDTRTGLYFQSSGYVYDFLLTELGTGMMG